jgi:hypothetical protein
MTKGILIGALLGATAMAVAAPTGRVANAIGGVAQAAPISGPSTTASCTITPTEIDFNSDGSFMVDIAVTLNNNTRVRHNGISADGTTFTLDGVAVSTPPAALQALGTHLAAAAPKITAAYSVASVQNALCGP